MVMGALLLHLGVCLCQGHEGPGEIIRRLSLEIDAGRASASNYLQRAIEYRILGKPSRAARDLQLAVGLNPTLVPAWREATKVFLDLGDSAAAERAARKALAACDPDSLNANSCRLLLAETLLRSGSFDRARDVIETAFQMWPHMDVNAYWLRAEILAASGTAEARAECLRRGWEATRSEALRIAWIESCIDSGRGADVLETIDQGLGSARLKSSWRLRRAKVMISLERPDEAQLELVAAITELDQRVNPQKPCREVIADRDLALDLLTSLGSGFPPFSE